MRDWMKYVCIDCGAEIYGDGRKLDGTRCKECGGSLVPIKEQNMRRNLTHKIINKKILPVYFESVKNGNKRFEIREDDDNIEVGDNVRLREWDGEKYTGREYMASVSYVLRDVPEYGLNPGYCIFGW